MVHFRAEAFFVCLFLLLIIIILILYNIYMQTQEQTRSLGKVYLQK